MVGSWSSVYTRSWFILDADIAVYNVSVCLAQMHNTDTLETTDQQESYLSIRWYPEEAFSVGSVDV